MVSTRLVGRRDCLGLAGAGLLLSACGSAPKAPHASLPALRLAPRLLDDVPLDLVQRLSVQRLDGGKGPEQNVDVLLSLSSQALRLAGFALNQRVLMMVWDGAELKVQRHFMLPAEVDTDRMLRDLTLVFWPVSAIQQALPAPWHLRQEGRERWLSRDGETVLKIQIEGDWRRSATVLLRNDLEHYALRIESKLQEPS